jgi:hypothetical protein
VLWELQDHSLTLAKQLQEQPCRFPPTSA